MLDDLYVVADDRPPATLRTLIAHAAEVRRSSVLIYPVLDAVPDLDFTARRLLDALDEDTRDLHHAAQAFALACLRAARHRWHGTDKQATTRARDRLDEARKARENQQALKDLRHKVAQRPSPPPPPLMPTLLEIP
ncbi:hypothetical protein GCM10008959_25570 [Deinococcus seoulensis]|uniref:Uncharacterized protein n=1 Tax=Deinococcus seoulensis TaxID=1837379 RepID=A0ABQ2RW49_9DEIO|nr:hypothetical protein [Deinococcus seoulensis]GGR62465.1 hypothetical protein GCM10008959_25570 [Deinococcus seoulensis]